MGTAATVRIQCKIDKIHSHQNALAALDGPRDPATPPHGPSSLRLGECGRLPGFIRARDVVGHHKPSDGGESEAESVCALR